MRGKSFKEKIKHFFYKKPRWVGIVFLVLVLLTVSLLVWRKGVVRGASFFSQSIQDSNSLPRTSFALNEKGYLNIRAYIDNLPNSQITIQEQFPSQVKYLQVSVTDKGSRTYTPTLTTLQNNTYQFNAGVVNYQYFCQAGETACIAKAVNQGGGQYLLSGNYIDLKIQIEFTGAGEFDLNSNFTGCESANPTQNANASIISYYSNQALVKSAALGPACVNSGELSPNITKSTLIEKNGQMVATNTFEAGDLVHVILTIYEPNEHQSDYKISDSLPEDLSGQIEVKISSPKGEIGKEQLTISPDHKITIEGNAQKALLKGINLIEYEYRI